MSDQQTGPRWWQASDGRWYPPESHPDPAYRSEHAPSGTDVGVYVTYPIRLSIARSPQIARWRPFAHWFMAIPHLVVAAALGVVAFAAMIIAWFAILVTGRLPEGLHSLITMSSRYTLRVGAFLVLLTNEYPPFDLSGAAKDPGTYALRVDYDYDSHPRNRPTVFFRWLMYLPHAFVLYFVQLAAYIVYFISSIAIVFMGRMPEPMASFLIGVGRWQARASAYASLLTDEYPPFSTS